MNHLKAPTFATLALAVVILLSAPAALAANSPNTVGNDISWPQCGRTLPSGQAFGIVGVNGGKATTTNPCLGQQLTWGTKSTGAAPGQPKLQLYVNTANPGQVIDQVTTWPTTNTDSQGYTTTGHNSPYDNPHGLCDGTNSLACSWQYGWNRSVEAVIDRFTPAAVAAKLDTNPAAYTWWLDVETTNTWETGAATELTKNTATLEGLTAYYQSRGAKVGLYSTTTQWASIVGSTVSITSRLNGLNSWLPGSRTLRGAQDRCSASPLTAGGKVTLSQYVSGSLDYDVSCLK